MKTKIVLWLAVCCLLSVLVTSVVTSRVQAQSPQPLLGGWPFSVNFVEDPFRMHGLQVATYHTKAIETAFYTLDTVPSNKKFIIVDIMVGGYYTNSEVIFLSPDGGTTIRAVIRVSNGSASLNAGIVFNPGEPIDITCGSSTNLDYVTISGYFVDL